MFVMKVVMGLNVEIVVIDLIAVRTVSLYFESYKHPPNISYSKYSSYLQVYTSMIFLKSDEH